MSIIANNVFSVKEYLIFILFLTKYVKSCLLEKFNRKTFVFHSLFFKFIPNTKQHFFKFLSYIISQCLFYPRQAKKNIRTVDKHKYLN